MSVDSLTFHAPRDMRRLSLALALLASVPAVAQADHEALAGRYELHSVFQGADVCLDAGDPSGADHHGAAHMAPCTGGPTQQWTLDPVETLPPHFFRLVAASRGATECLSGDLDAPTHDGEATMADCTDTDDQHWLFVDAGEESFRILVQFDEQGLCLDSNDPASSTKGGASFLDECRDVSGQYWTLSPVGDDVRMDGGEALVLPLYDEALERDVPYLSPDGAFFVVFQGDGNLVVYTTDGGYVWGLDQTDAPFWTADEAVMQADGNLALYTADGDYVWSALTETPNPDALLSISPDGALQLVVDGGGIVWSSF